MIRYLYFLPALFLLSCDNQSTKGSVNAKPVEKIDSTQSESEDNKAYFDLDNFQKLVEQYEDPKRATWQNPALVIDKLGKVDNKTIADIGAGTGYFTFRLAEKGAKVIAIDIDNRFLEHIENRKSELSNVIEPQQITTRHSKENDPLLKANEIDLALLVNTYHFIENRSIYLKKISEGLKENGEIVIVDYMLGENAIGPPEDYKVSFEQAISEIENAGLKILEVDLKSLNYQYIIKAKKQ